MHSIITYNAVKATKTHKPTYKSLQPEAFVFYTPATIAQMKITNYTGINKQIKQLKKICSSNLIPLN